MLLQPGSSNPTTMEEEPSLPGARVIKFHSVPLSQPIFNFFVIILKINIQ